MICLTSVNIGNAGWNAQALDAWLAATAQGDATGAVPA
jgi:hypothetical protein